MAFTPFDFNEAISQRRDHASEGLRHGSPVVAIGCEEGLVLLTVRRTQRKVFEIYDRIIYSAIGNQSDIEAVRLGAVDLAAREGFERSPDDVTAQRLVGFSLSPALKEVFRDQFRSPSIIRAMFGEMAETPADDVVFVLNYDGEFAMHRHRAAIAGSQDAEDAMLDALQALKAGPPMAEALPVALRAWGIGVAALTNDGPDDDQTGPGSIESRVDDTLRERLAHASVEVGILNRRVTRDTRFRLLGPDETDFLVAPYAAPAAGKRPEKGD